MFCVQLISSYLYFLNVVTKYLCYIYTIGTLCNNIFRQHGQRGSLDILQDDYRYMFIFTINLIMLISIIENVLKLNPFLFYASKCPNLQKKMTVRQNVFKRIRGMQKKTMMSKYCKITVFVKKIHFDQVILVLAIHFLSVQMVLQKKNRLIHNCSRVCFRHQ